MASTIITLLIALAIILVSLGCLVWIIADTYYMWQFRRQLYAKVGEAVSDEQ